MTKYEAFAYADDLKLVILKPEKIQKDLQKVENCCNANKMKLNDSKIYILPIKHKQNRNA